MTRISANFTLAELTKTGTGLPNKPDDNQLASMKVLAEKVLEPIRAHFGPVVVNSCLRSEFVNKAVGGSPTSQHKFGEAADIEVRGVSNYDLAVWIRNNIEFDQLILENYTPGVPGSGWVHVSYRAKRLRRSVLTMTYRKGKATYTAGIIK